MHTLVFRHEEISAILSEIQSKFAEVIQKLDSSLQQTKILHRMLTLLFYAADKFKDCCESDSSGASNVSLLQGMFDEICNSLSGKWFFNNFSVKFGRPSSLTTTVKFYNHVEEIKVHHY